MLVSRKDRPSGHKSIALATMPATQLSIVQAASVRSARAGGYSEGRHLQLMLMWVATLFLALVMLALALLISNPAFLRNDLTQPYDWNNWTPGQYPALRER